MLTGAAVLSLSPLEFDVVAEHLGLETMPLVLKVPSPGRTHSERAELARSVWNGLAARGLGGPTALDPDLEWMLRLLARPVREVDARMWRGNSVRLLAAADGASTSAQAVLAVKNDQGISLRPAAATGLAREALSVLPPAPAGPGRSVTVYSGHLDAAAAEANGDLARFDAALRQRGTRPDDAETLTRMVAEAGTRGQFGAAARHGSLRRTRASHVVGFFESAHGRYVQLRRETPSGELWSTIAPVDARRMLGHVEELLAEVTER